MGTGNPALLNPALRIGGLCFGYDSGSPLIHHLDLVLEQREIFSLLGPSGCGKSTLLKLIAGHLFASHGSLEINGETCTHLPPEKRKVGMVFQHYALFPHLSALDNVAFPLRIRKVPKSARHQRAGELLDWVGFTAREKHRRPGSLSGGQQQRVALARAIASRPELLLLDEPFANLDRALRERLRGETRDLLKQLNQTAILVTHDREEAFSFGDRIGLMLAGRLLQVGTPAEVYRNPRGAGCARILGHPNVLTEGKFLDGAYVRTGFRIPLDGPEPPERTQGVLLAPDKIQVLESGHPDQSLSATVRSLRFHGHHHVLAVDLNGEISLEIHLREAEGALTAGKQVGLRFPPESWTALPDPAGSTP